VHHDSYACIIDPPILIRSAHEPCPSRSILRCSTFKEHPVTTATTGLTLADLFPPDDLAAAIEAGHVTRKSHPDLPLSIFTYTRDCQYGHIWTPVTMACRGLIADDVTGGIVAFPFPKIFVTAMHGVHDFAPPLPAEPFEVFDKADGSLIIVFHYDGRWHAASKGSFISEQADWAQQWLDAADLSRLDPQLTYLAEAIYPANRIVCDYGPREDLALLAADRLLGLNLSPRRAAAALAVSAVTHYVADRQGGHWRDEHPRGVVQLAAVTGHRGWLKRDPGAGYLLDQSWHKGWIAVAAMVAAGRG
jgi:hypothetical protein